MSRIITIGESAYDILFKNGKPYDGKVGGAIINTSISLGRLGENICLVGDAADDQIGHLIINYLNENQVDTTHFQLYPNSRSRLALAFLDTPDSPEYLFFKLSSNVKVNLNFPKPIIGDIILFGSFYSIKPDLRDQIFDFLIKAKEKGALIIYDPNFRKNHKIYLPELLPNILQNIEIADIIKGSDEDFNMIFNYSSIEEVATKIVHFDKKILFYTQGRKSIRAGIFGKIVEFPIQQVETISAVGAGDSFNAGLIFELSKRYLTSATISQLQNSDWEKIIATASNFAAHVCMSNENYVSQEFADKVKYLK